MSGRPRWPYVEDLVKSSLAIYFQGLHRKYGSGSWNSFDSQKCRHWKFWSIYISDASLPRQTDVLPCQTCLAMILMIWYDILPVKPCFPRLTYASGNGERWLLFHFSFPWRTHSHTSQLSEFPRKSSILFPLFSPVFLALFPFLLVSLCPWLSHLFSLSKIKGCLYYPLYPWILRSFPLTWKSLNHSLVFFFSSPPPDLSL